MSLWRLSTPRSNFNYSALCGGAGRAEESIPNPTLALIHLFPRLHHQQLLGEAGAGIEQSFRRINTVCLYLCLLPCRLRIASRAVTPTIIINSLSPLPGLLTHSCCRKDEMMDNVRCGNWMSCGKGKERRDRCFIMRCASPFGPPEQRPKAKPLSAGRAGESLLVHCRPGLLQCLCSLILLVLLCLRQLGFPPISCKCCKANKIDPGKLDGPGSETVASGPAAWWARAWDSVCSQTAVHTLC